MALVRELQQRLPKVAPSKGSGARHLQFKVDQQVSKAIDATLRGAVDACSAIEVVEHRLNDFGSEDIKKRTDHM